MNVLELLERGRARIARRWSSQGAGDGPYDNEHGSYCMLSSLWAKGQSYTKGVPEDHREAYEQAVCLLEEGVLKEWGRSPSKDDGIREKQRTVYSYNDSSYSSKEAVLQIFDDAIATGKERMNGSRNT